MLLSIIVASYNTAEPLRTCIASILSEVKRMSISAEVIVVDNGSTDGTSLMVATEFPGVKLINNQLNEYFVRGIDRGYSKSSGKFILVVGSDVEVVPGAIGGALDFMDLHPQAGAASCKIVNHSMELQATGGRFLTLTSDLFEWTRLGWLFPSIRHRLREFHYMPSWNRKDTREVDTIVANFMIFRRSAVQAVGGFFDSRFIMFFAEDELCWRLKKKGWKVFHLGNIYVFHTGRLTLDKFDGGFLSKLTLVDRLEYHKAVLGPFRALVFRVAFNVDALVTKLLRHTGLLDYNG